MFRVLHALAAGALLSFSAVAHAQPQAFTLSEAQRLAVARSQQLVANQAATTATREMGVAAGQLPDPVLKLGVQNVPISGPERFSLTRDFMTMQSVSVMQELTRKEKRELRVERTARDAERLAAERQSVISEIQRETALAYVEAAYTQAAVHLVQEQIGQARLAIEAAEVAFRSGRGSQAEVFAARSMLATLEDQLRLTQRQARNGRLMLARWIGASGQERPLATPVDWTRTATEQLVSAQNWSRLPRLALLQAQVEAAQTELRQAQANTRPDWTVEAMYSRRGPAYSDMVSIGVSVPLQLDRANRQDREVAAKLAMLSEARARYDDALLAEQAAVRVLLNEWTSGKERLAGLKADLLAAARHRAEAALVAYRTGKGDLASAIAAQRDEVDARLRVLTLEMDVARAWAQLDSLFPNAAVAAHKE